MRFVVAIGCAVGCVSCAPPVESTSSTVFASSNVVLVTSRDDDALVEVDASTLREVKRAATPKGPEHVLVAGGFAWVTASLDTSVARINLADFSGARSTIDVPCGGTSDIARDEARKRVVIACPNDDRVVFVDDSLHVVARVDVAGRPSALAIRGDDLFVATSKPPANLFRYNLADLTLAESTPLANDGPGPSGSNAAVQAAAIAFVNNDPVVAYTVVDHDDRGLPVDQGGYGSVVDGKPRIEPRLSSTHCTAHPAKFDGGARVLSGPSSLVATSSGTILLAGQFTDSVLAFDCALGGANGDDGFSGAVRTGRGPRGLALSSDGRTLFVDAGFDLAIDRVDVAKLTNANASATTGSVVQPDLARVRTLGASRLSAAARRGQATFNDAVNTHITPSGVVTCASCHPNGGDDGVTWFFHTENITPRVRRTQSAWGGRTELAPFHWDGEFTNAGDLAKSTTQELLGGDALLVQFDDVAAFMQEVPMPPQRPVDDANLVARGKALFNDATVGCATCHAGDLFADGKRHAVLAATGDNLVDITGGADTPSLLAVRTRAPYLHDGSAPSLEARIDDNPSDVHGKTSQLSAADRKALVAYLESL